ncbi:phage tail assembly chaperone [Pararhizobium sp. PWRC1-1]|uniref:phage tail assembly chaperone n=1 Tax=Pararhizobium sp. PWRC1-1 TaxID=2804566 RepID=UPI003CF9DE39
MRENAAPGFSGPAPVSNQELTAWLAITGNVIRREEVRILKTMNSRYCAEIDRESDAIRERETEK